MIDNNGKVKNSEPTYTVCGVRDGILFRFDLCAQTDRQKLGAYVCVAVEEKIKLLSPLLKKSAIVYIEGVNLGEMERIALEQRLGEILDQEVCVQMRKRKAKQPQSLVHIGTLRGGMYLCAEADLTVIGDVHPGARLEAGGSIFVFGKLQGSVFAGVHGAENAVVAAWQMQPQMLCIAKADVARVGVKASDAPMLARLCEEKIIFTKLP